MTTLNIDIETYSSVDLIKSGVYKYVESEDFEILLFAYSFDDGPVEVVEWGTELMPLTVVYALKDPSILKTAFNANFERTCITKYLNIDLPVNQWECSLSKAAMLGLPLSLDAAAKALKLTTKKDAAGKALIKYFSVPCKPTIVNGGRTRNMPQHGPDKWQQFKEYCRQDVIVEKAIRDKIAFFDIPAEEKRLWCLDQKINDNGVLLDPVLVKNSISIDATLKEKLTAEAIELTGLNNPNSAAQLKEWLSREMDEEITTLRKDDVPTLLASTSCEIVTKVLKIRQEMSKTSVKKYIAMSKGIGEDNRVRGLLQYYGANRTGRWAGRLVQVQNLPRNEMKSLDLARNLVRDNDLDTLELLYDSVPDTLSQLIRTAFVAPAGKKFVIADFSAIEARVIAWLAGEQWRLDVFKTHGKIYEASASQMFKIPLENITKDLRQKGKVSELALGYQGGPNALITMGALKMGLKEEELPALVKMWRNANRKIVEYWQTVNEAAIHAVETGCMIKIKPGLTFYAKKGILFIELPCGRVLSYINAKLKDGKFGPTLTYEGMDQTTKQWRTQDTYGGKLVENITQAIARDCLATAMLRVDSAGYSIVMHVHDEIVIEIEDENDCIAGINIIMAEPISWAKGLLLKAESYESKYYKKD